MQHRPSSARFKLNPGEKLLGRAEVVADTPALAGVAAMVWVTERRVVLCRVPARLLTLATIAAGAAAAASGPIEGPVQGVLVVLFLAMVIFRGRLRFRRVLLEARGSEVAEVSRGAAAIGVFLLDGSTWRLKPARHLLVVPGPVAQQGFAAAGLALLRLVGRAGWAPGQRAVLA